MFSFCAAFTLECDWAAQFTCSLTSLETSTTKSSLLSPSLSWNEGVTGLASLAATDSGKITVRRYRYILSLWHLDQKCSFKGRYINSLPGLIHYCFSGGPEGAHNFKLTSLNGDRCNLFIIYLMFTPSLLKTNWCHVKEVVSFTAFCSNVFPATNRLVKELFRFQSTKIFFGWLKYYSPRKKQPTWSQVNSYSFIVENFILHLSIVWI